MDAEEDRKPKLPEIVIGQDLDIISIAELERRIEILNREIDRLKAAIAAKKSSINAANAVFKL
jgi:uncharacterized small protein (DUF1192 family)